VCSSGPGIDEIVTSSDLVKRCVFLVPPAILDCQRRPQQELSAEFEADRPLLLGAPRPRS
jgi:hypothetical protein